MRWPSDFKLKADEMGPNAGGSYLARLSEAVCASSPKASRRQVGARVFKLVGEIGRGNNRLDANLTDEIHQARADVLIFLYLSQYGWGRPLRYSSGAVVAVDSPVSQMERLGFPSRARLVDASRRVRRACPEGVAQYKAALKSFREALRRHRATETEEAWRWFICGAGNRRSLAYRSEVALKRRGGLQAYYRQHRYLYSELLPRRAERKRAWREMREADRELVEAREQIFEAMGVPQCFRRLVL
jgi:hypothetical protein